MARAGWAALTGGTGQVTAGNVISRVTGVARLVAVAAALGTTYLGNTYQSANVVSNLLFELLAAGMLSSVLVPPLVRLFDSGRQAEAEELAGAVLGVVLALLAAVTVAGLLGREWIMRALTTAVEDPQVRAAEVRLGKLLLVAFLPQVLLYAVGATATALLHSVRRFAAAALAPVANNLVVVATMALFVATGGGRRGLEVGGTPLVVLALGTTAGVAAMTLVPVVALARAGVRLRPRWIPAQPELRSLWRPGAWAAASLAATQVLVAVTVVLANRVEGGVVAYHLAFTAFLLPHAVLAHPVSTTAYPGLAAAAARQGHDFSVQLSRALRALAFRVTPAAALLVVAGGPALALVRLGRLDEAGAALTAATLGAYSLGLLGYGTLHLLTRASYAVDDARASGVVSALVAVGGVVLMLVGTTVAPPGVGTMVALGLAHSLAVSAGAVLLAAALHRRTPGPWPVAVAVARALITASAAGAVAWAVSRVLPSPDSRPTAALAVLVSTTVVLGVYLAGQRALGAPELTEGLGLRFRRGVLPAAGPGPDSGGGAT